MKRTSRSRPTSYDVVVLGGGSAGVAAAIGAARAGARVALAERNGFLGGAATASSVMAYCGFFADGNEARQIVGGIGQELLAAIEQLGFNTAPVLSSSGHLFVPINAEVVKVVLDRLVSAERAIDLYLHTHFAGATTTAARLETASLRDPEGQFDLAGASFVDTSGDAVLCDEAYPSSIRIPAPSRRQVATQVMRIGGVKQGASLDRGSIRDAVRNARLGERFGSPLRETGFVHHVPGTSDVVVMLADQETDGLTAESLTEAEVKGRELNAAYMSAFRNYLSGFEEAFIVETGPRIGVRQSRSTIGRYTMRGEDLLQGKTYSDQIALGGWPLEIRDEVGRERYVPIPPPGSFGIPIGALALRDAENVWLGGRTIACDDDAYGSLRTMGTAFATGHAAGVAATLAVDADLIDHTERTRDELSRQGAILQ